MKLEELVPVFGENRFIRIQIPQESKINISYQATVDNSIKLVDFKDAKEVPVSEMDSAVLTYLYPSRYCQSDKLYRLANNNFGKISNPYSKVIAVTDWINNNIEYLSGSTNSQTSAYETITEQAGVCRDFAHLGIALCRALTIPARYFTGYAFKLKPPDFHACFEAYIGGEWILFDATKLSPLNGLVKIATGRDAADTAVASIFGNFACNSILVSSQLADDNFEPFFYQPSEMMGLSYL
jgi:transglutaminase-like putative cysteine protease